MAMRIIANRFGNLLRGVNSVKSPQIGGTIQPRRNLNIHENLSMKLLNDAGVPVSPFVVVDKKGEAAAKAKTLNTNDLVVKAQVLSGGRGKGSFKGGLQGGVKLVNSPEEAQKFADQMIGDFLITKQTGAKGIICNTVMITVRKDLVKEYYLAIMMERQYGGPVIISSSQGGMEIEVLSASHPEAIDYTAVDVEKGLTPEQATQVATKLGAKDKNAASDVIMKLYDLFIKKDATLVEVNPLGEDKDGKIWCLDAKLRFDDSAQFRQKELHALRDLSQEDEKEIQAAKHDLNYVAMEGNIGCLVNGAGLAMATMDIIQLHGGVPANFLDVGGGASEEQVKNALAIISSDPNVKAIFVNIFGGIMRCDIIAAGLIKAMKELNFKIPIVCRLQGTMVEEANELITKSGIKIISNPDLEEASKTVVKAVKG